MEELKQQLSKALEAIGNIDDCKIPKHLQNKLGHIYVMMDEFCDETLKYYQNNN